ncbi:unnamed protein product [Arctogadus glacialis]
MAGYKDRTVKTKAWLKVSEEVGLTEEECRRSSNMVLGVEVDGIAEYPVEDHGSEAAAGTASDLGVQSLNEVASQSASLEEEQRPAEGKQDGSGLSVT